MKKPNIRTDDAESLLLNLYLAGTTFLEEYPWEFEHDRWRELIVCLLIATRRIDANAARSVVEVLNTLGIASCRDLAESRDDERSFIVRVFVQHGCSQADAAILVDRIVSTAKLVVVRWGGSIQLLLRRYGQLMANELSGKLVESGVEKDVADAATVLWLQNVANLPLLLETDAHIQTFCQTHKLSTKDLVVTADRLGLNIAVLDDLLSMEVSAMAEDQNRTKRTGSKVRPSPSKTRERGTHR